MIRSDLNWFSSWWIRVTRLLNLSWSLHIVKILPSMLSVCQAKSDPNADSILVQSTAATKKNPFTRWRSNSVSGIPTILPRRSDKSKCRVSGFGVSRWGLDKSVASSKTHFQMVILCKVIIDANVEDVSAKGILILTELLGNEDEQVLIVTGK